MYNNGKQWIEKSNIRVRVIHTLFRIDNPTIHLTLKEETPRGIYSNSMAYFEVRSKRDHLKGWRRPRKEEEIRRPEEKVERIQEEVKIVGRCCCRHGGLFDPLSLFPPDLSRGHAYRVFFNREIHDPRLSRRSLYALELQERKSGSRRGRSGSKKWVPVRLLACTIARFRLSASYCRFIQPLRAGYIEPSEHFRKLFDKKRVDRERGRDSCPRCFWNEWIFLLKKPFIFCYFVNAFLDFRVCNNIPSYASFITIQQVDTFFAKLVRTGTRDQPTSTNLTRKMKWSMINPVETRPTLRCRVANFLFDLFWPRAVRNRHLWAGGMSRFMFYFSAMLIWFARK